MNSLLRWSLTGASGACVLLAILLIVVDLRAPWTRVRLALVVAASCTAAYAYAALGVYRSSTIEDYVSGTRVHITFAVTAYLALLWFLAVRTRALPRWSLWLATGASAAVIAWNLASPNTLIFADVLELQGVLLPWGEVTVQVVAIPSQWSHLVEALTFTFYGMSAYSLLSQSDDEQAMVLPVACSMAVLLATMVVEASDPRVVPMLPADELGLFALILVLPVATRSKGPTGR
jgi:putative flippase GtrA